MLPTVGTVKSAHLRYHVSGRAPTALCWRWHSCCFQVAFRVLGEPGDSSSAAAVSDFTPFLAAGGPDETEARISGLAHSAQYEFVVRAVNACGPGPQSAPSAPVRTLGRPSGACAAKACRVVA